MTSALTDNFPGVRIRRFIKSDGKFLQTVKLTFFSKAQFNKASTYWVFIDHSYYQPVELIQRGIRIIRCYRCQNFGYFCSNCHSKVSCKLCYVEHSVENCQGNQPANRCANRSGNHETKFLDCPTFINQEHIFFYERRGLQAPTPRNPV